VGVKGVKKKQPADTVIRVEGVTKNFPFGDKQEGKLFVLRGITLQVERGQVVAIVGASGAGKSTLLHIIGTLDRPTTGKVHYEDTDVFALDDDKLARFRNREIGFVFQFHHLLPEFSALENVAMPALIAGNKMSDVKNQALEYLKLVGLGERAFQKPTKLSGGEQQRVAVARALMNSPEVILADEPSGNLDTTNAEVLHELIRDLSHKRGQTFVVVTHNEALARQADKIVRIVDGVISAASVYPKQA
jgi:lipoprotein-releasing system ATP-binding protein